MIKLEVTNLKKTYGTHTVFSEVSLEKSGGSLGIAGPNGSGKSTFLKCLGGLLRPTSGKIHWRRNEKLFSSHQFSRKLGYAAPYINLYDELTCRENLHFLRKVRHETNREPNIVRWLDRCGLRHVADQPFGTLSTGQQQRLRLASALFHDPDILLLDEPGSNLDEAGRGVISDIATEFENSEKLLIIASNDTQELKLCERIFSIEQEKTV